MAQKVNQVDDERIAEVALGGINSPFSSPSPPRLCLAGLGLDSVDLSGVRQVHNTPRVGLILEYNTKTFFKINLPQKSYSVQLLLMIFCSWEYSYSVLENGLNLCFLFSISNGVDEKYKIGLN